MRLTGVYGDMRKGQFVTVSEWMSNGNIMEYIEKNHTNRLELVRDFISPPSQSLKCGDSCMGQPRVCDTSVVLVSHMGTSRGLCPSAS